MKASYLNLILSAALLLALILACTRKPARFAHSQHLGLNCTSSVDKKEGSQIPRDKECLTCVSCHSGLDKGELNPGHPRGKNCKGCHTKDAHQVQASLRAPRSSASKLAATIQFNHQKHLKMSQIGGQCIKCHSGLVSENAGANFPPMATCFACHNHQEEWENGECTPCHQEQDLKHLFPRTFLRHGVGWDKNHASAAAMTTVQCAQCHSEESCDDCHNVSAGLKVEVRRAADVDADFTHPADFITRHAMEAASEPAKCLSCHREETCSSCHLARGVSAARIGAVNPHPPGWSGPNSSMDNQHGRAARRDILSCATCHDQGSQTNCIQCHQVGGSGGNPHPAGWKSSRTPADQMCAYCHEAGL